MVHLWKWREGARGVKVVVVKGIELYVYLHNMVYKRHSNRGSDGRRESEYRMTHARTNCIMNAL